jgi:predicted anti-sigma-YlaC factor YlaD
MADPAEPITCQEVVELVTDYLEGTLSPEQAERFEEHLDLCKGCDSYVDQMRTTVETVGKVREEDLPPETRDRLLAAFRNWKRSS